MRDLATSQSPQLALVKRVNLTVDIRSANEGRISGHRVYLGANEKE